MCCEAERRTASLSRRRTRLRSTAVPTFFDTVKPTRAGPSSSRRRAWSTKAGAGIRVPAATARNSARRLRRSIRQKPLPRSGAQPLASARAPGGHHLAPALGRHAGTETVTALAHQLARLIGPLHGVISAAIAFVRAGYRWAKLDGDRKRPWPRS